MAEEQKKKGLLSRARSVFEHPLPDDVPASEGERDKLSPGVADLVGGGLAGAAVPFLTSLHPVGAVLGLLGFGLLSGQEAKREKLAQRLVDREVLKKDKEFRRGLQTEKFGHDIALQTREQQAALEQVMAGIDARSKELQETFEFNRSEGLKDRVSREAIARQEKDASRIVGLANILENISQNELQAAQRFSYDPDGAQQALKGLAIIKAIIFKDLVSQLRPGENISGLSEEELKNILGLASPSEGAFKQLDGGDASAPFEEIGIDPDTGEKIFIRGGR